MEEENSGQNTAMNNDHSAQDINANTDFSAQNDVNNEISGQTLNANDENSKQESESAYSGKETKFCSHCGAKIMKDAEICIKCGCACEDVRKKEKPKIENQTNVLILSIINTIFCCLPLGIISLIFIFLAMSADTQEEADKKIDVAKKCNYVGIGLGIVVLILYFFLFFFGAVTSY